MLETLPGERILLLDPPYDTHGRSVYQEECCTGSGLPKAWTSKTSFLAEALSKNGALIRHIDLRFRNTPEDIEKKYDRVLMLSSKVTSDIIPVTVNMIDPLGKLRDKIGILAAMLGEEKTLGTIIKDKYGLEFPAYNSRLLPSDHYPLGAVASPVPVRLCEKYYYAISSGCSYGCLHCPWGEYREIWRPVDILGQDIKWLRKFNPRHNWNNPMGSIYFECAQINSNHGWLKELHHSFLNKEIDPITWTTDMNILGLTEEILDILQEVGCRRAVIGFDALNPKALALIGKKHTVENILQASKMLARSRILISAHFLCGYGETPDMIYDGIDIVRQMASNGFKPYIVKYASIQTHEHIRFNTKEIPSDVMRAHIKLLDTMASCGWRIEYFRP